MPDTRVCNHPDCNEHHQNSLYCSRLHQRLDNLGISIPDGAEVCSECRDAWAEIDGLCSNCHSPVDSEADTPDRGNRRISETRHEDGDRSYRLFHGIPHTWEEARDRLEIDMKRWKLTRWNRWEQSPDYWCHQIRLTPRSQVISCAELIDAQLERLRREVQPAAAPSYPNVNDADRHYVLEPYLTDWHISMYAYAPETRGVHWDTEIAIRLFIWGLKDLVTRARRLAGKIDRIILPLGNDLAHSDAWAGTGSGAATASGTLVDVDTRRKRMKKQLWATVEQALLYLKTVAPVDVYIVPGNHSPETEFTMGQIANARFHNDDAVTVDNGDSKRKYAHFGSVLLGFAHGHEVAKKRLPMMPMIEKPQAWADVLRKDGIVEIHRGHDHHLDQRGFAMEAEEDVSIRVRSLPTIVPRDAWHADRGYKHYRAAEAFLWSHEYGFEGLVNSTPRSIEAAAKAGRS